MHVVHMTTHIVYIHMYKWVMDIWWSIRGFGLLGRWTIREDILCHGTMAGCLDFQL